jgi:TRAP-type C4-dicarboxylate transport system permease small subunit
MLGRLYVNLIESLIILGLCAMVALTFTSTAFRFFGYGGIFWAEEVTRYISIWVIFLAAGLGVRYGIHLRVEIVGELVPAGFKKVLNIFSHIMVLTFAGLLLYYGTKLSISNYAQQSASLRMPMTYVNAAIPVGAILMIHETLRLLITSRDYETFDSTF